MNKPYSRLPIIMDTFGSRMATALFGENVQKLDIWQKNPEMFQSSLSLIYLFPQKFFFIHKHLTIEYFNRIMKKFEGEFHSWKAVITVASAGQQIFFYIAFRNINASFS